MSSVLVTIYNPADLFPPTLNAVRTLAEEFDEVVLVTTRQGSEGKPGFPVNVRVVYAVENMLKPASPAVSMARFVQFTRAVWKEMVRTRFDVSLMYDPHAWLSVILSRRFFAKAPRLYWYHNHDVYELATQRKFSAAWYAVKQEAKHFGELDVFSLPANERKKYFPVNALKGSYFFIPNYPSSGFMEQFGKAKQSGQFIRLIHQGRISAGHGFEEIIEILRRPVNGKQLKLVLKGFVQPAYRMQLVALAELKGVADHVEFHGPSAYADVPKITAGCHIGLAIHQKKDLMNTTLGTSSNKIYEYAALGVPVILYDTPHFREHLDRYSWASFTDCTAASLLNCIKNIDDNFAKLSAEAHNDFAERLNFEAYFKQAVAFCRHAIASSLSVPAS